MAALLRRIESSRPPIDSHISPRASQMKITVILVTGSAIVIVVAGAKLQQWYTRRKALETKAQQNAQDSAQEIRNILEASRFGNRNLTVKEKYQARAGPNQRLISAFAVYNCFTTDNILLCTRFRKAAETKLKVDEDRWQSIASTANYVVRHFVENRQAVESGRLRVVPLVQTVTLKLAMDILLDFKADRHDKDGSISALAEEINKQWIKSKAPFNQEVEPDWVFHKQTQLLHSLKDIFDWDGSDSESNPMNFLLPGYETLWRVVLRCFLELNYRGHQQSLQWQEIVRAFAEHPSLAQLEDRSVNDSNVSALAIAQEALRLYPPTRRVYRESLGQQGDSVVVSADVEHLHRNKHLWGADALAFDPSRWYRLPIADESTEKTATTGLSKFAEDHFTPFGRKPFRCPAKRRAPKNDSEPSKDLGLPFGVSMICVLVAGLTDVLAEGGWRLERGGLEDYVGVPLNTDREAYYELSLESST